MIRAASRSSSAFGNVTMPGIDTWKPVASARAAASASPVKQ